MFDLFDYYLYSTHYTFKSFCGKDVEATRKRLGMEIDNSIRTPPEPIAVSDRLRAALSLTDRTTLIKVFISFL